MNDEPINPETLAAAERWAGSNRRRFMRLSMWEAKKQSFLAGCEYITNQQNKNHETRETGDKRRGSDTER